MVPIIDLAINHSGEVKEMFIIAGIGSRKTPKTVLKKMAEIGKWIADNGGWIRSGHAPGADLAFEMGARNHTIIYLPWPGFGGHLYTTNVIYWNNVEKTMREKAIQAVKKFHPAPERLSPGGLKLMGRNYFQIFGSRKKARPVDAVVCWTPGGRGGGGTGQAIRLAKANGIPVIDLAINHSIEEIRI